MNVAHIPVLLEEVANNLVSGKDKLFIDATVGGGGHSSCLLEKYPDLSVIGLDMDDDALAIAGDRLRGFEGRVMLVRGNFRDLRGLLEGINVLSFDGILFDLGFSMFQMGGGRGFSFNDDAFLDMRMDDRQPLTAYDVVNSYGYEALKKVIAEYGEDYKAAKIARVITEERKKKPISTAKELSAVVLKAKKRTGRVHPATKTFQAIRIEVNGELDNVRSGLADAIAMVRPAGRIGVISFHSLEDRIVKEMFRTSPLLKAITKKPIRPGRPEILTNPRARSAKLRIAEKKEEA
ncbi:16S rRNA (cytosine(1402)-N(4))-methyltransferase RsmH [Syntrophorhabdus aromaticivorans]|jgi:16S rRNA (cytosine1402-N4)-methyltransferase|uniref:Ribosomal RNA small subunit methyltransferase H n=1 Tax=Syntrophorhabdus aromaticivorans TaxID=328301 RepID=A0A351U1C3_9BACT|nr:16S rRNA (cytosine(1402)-N(4))-methyltransferase RsmH [Syntrophorhabdus aromaticivorans]NLW36716.1 16S rRNA (cytosine(1402)-N(4))-methyltransferase RsmH [Syntrophorhabdus aromaticivorans]HBA53754.1 16S rRNA (cytosine(1402)-N(4))-methyltransferase RsmH [Syntrophorhabdus aromaticivorans]